MTALIEGIYQWSPQIYAAALVLALAILAVSCLSAWRDARGSGVVVTGQALIGRDQATADRRRLLKKLQYRIARRDPRRI